MLCAAVQRRIDAVLIPEGIAEPHRHIVSSRCVHRKTVGHRAVIAQGCDAVFNGDNAGCAGVAVSVPVDENSSELGFLLLAVGSQVAPAVVCVRKLRVPSGSGTACPAFYSDLLSFRVLSVRVKGRWDTKEPVAEDTHRPRQSENERQKSTVGHLHSERSLYHCVQGLMHPIVLMAISDY